MGVQFEIHDIKNKRIFDLDKGPASEHICDALEDPLMFCIRGLDNLTLDMLALWKGGNGPQDEAYVRDWAKRVWTFCEAAEWEVAPYRDDTSDPCPYGSTLNWPVVDTRFRAT